MRGLDMQCLVFVQDDGEKSIMQGPSSIDLINAQAVNEYFGKCGVNTIPTIPALILTLDSDDVIQQHASMVTTEISQVPLSGVLALLNSARFVCVASPTHHIASWLVCLSIGELVF